MTFSPADMRSTDRPQVNLEEHVEHTLLDPFASEQAIEQLCGEAEHYRFPTVCVSPCHIGQAVELLHRSDVEVCTVVAFPSGTSTSDVKLFEAQQAVDLGADALDVVINFGWLRDQSLDRLYQEIAEICDATQKPVKAILEMTRLSQSEKQIAAEICLDAGVAYLKTSTGWFGGATVEDVTLLHQIARGRVGIKASGGIRTYEQALNLIQAGANRLGTSRGVELMKYQDQFG